MRNTTPQPWTKENMAKALNTAVAVELFTIPVYLSAASSIKESDRATKSITATLPGPNGTTTTEQFSPYDVIMSVAVQEMFHLTMACNLANAMGVRPTITAPDLSVPPSCLTGIAGMPVKGNLSTLIDTMLAIEAPDPKYHYDEDPAHPISPNGPTHYQEDYDSIGDLYHAIAYGVEQLWAYDPANDHFQKSNFEAKYPDVKPIIQSLQDALNAIASIVEQGEGNGVNGFMPPSYIPAAGQQYQEEDEVSHWERFNDIKQFLLGGGVIPQYEETITPIATNAPHQLTETYSKLIQQMAHDFTAKDTNLNLRGMASTATIATSIWQAGLVPQWDYIDHPTPWPALPKGAHVCQGLNTCAGLGYNNSGTTIGDGDCATVEQACSTTNNCKGLGACGYVPPGQAPTPGQNDCSGQGGCQSPISPCQYYGPDTTTYPNQYVWDVARDLFMKKMIKEGKLAPDDELPVITKINDRRYSPSLNPTSGKNGNTCPKPGTN